MKRLDDTILLIRFSSLGDLVLLTSLVEALHTGLPGIKLHLVTKERYRALFEHDRRIDRISALAEHGGLASLRRLWSSLRGSRYGVIADAHGVIRSVLLSRSLAAGRRVRIAKDQLGKAAVLAGRRGGPVVTMRERYLGIARSLGADLPDAMPRLEPGGRAREQARKLFREKGLDGRSVVAIAPGARWPSKRWPAARYAELARILGGEGHGIVLIGGEGDRDACSSVAEGSPGAIDLCGRLGVPGTAAVLERAALVVTNDSAPLHIAEAAGTPVVALYGPTVREFGYFPLLGRSVPLEADVACRPCSRNGARPCRRPRLECLEAIPLERVADAARAVLAEAGEP